MISSVARGRTAKIESGRVQTLRGSSGELEGRKPDPATRGGMPRIKPPVTGSGTARTSFEEATTNRQPEVWHYVGTSVIQIYWWRWGDANSEITAQSRTAPETAQPECG